MGSNNNLCRITTILSECITVEYRNKQLDRFNEILNLLNMVVLEGNKSKEV